MKDGMDILKVRDSKVAKEQERLTTLFQNLPSNKKKLAEGLIIQAARLRVMLDELWIELSLNGDVESFRQSEKLEGYERERPSAKLYNSRDATYHKIIKQLCDLLPEEEKKNAMDGCDLI